MKRADRWLLFAATAFIALQFALSQQRHELRLLVAQRDSLRDEHRELLDENRNLRLEKQALFNPMDLAGAAKTLGMREPSLADGTLVFLRGDKS